ncbi:tetratricopeptide repeat protein [Bradyrhizobium hipponense]|uniref:Tetratricopeptide repeat protein n=1 Tax=Bradyrhizobium hipponense TaxID=2605638 RepID=A0A5S4YMA8_9BRAD|nr:tetratricopeptide repeat protein [Bradyrhizobium hipponense]TYO61479.1 tetratricopeptide repeat protein [Bradyrhizobium hipponense]
MSDGVQKSIENDLDAQIAELTAAISRNPRDLKAYRQRGLLKARMRRYDDALNDFNRTLALDPNDAHAYGLRALVWARKGDRDRALVDFDEAIRLAPQNGELYRSHRDRVLAESSRAPIEGGDFSILKNPFVLLGLPPTAAPALVKEAYEDAVEDEVDDVDVLMRAQQTLMTPRLRIEAEVGGFLDVDPRLTSQIVSNIRVGATIDEISEQLGKLHSLPRSNVIAHYGSALPLEMAGLCELIAAQATVTPGAVCDAINDVREEIALGRVDREQVSEALSKLLDRQTKAVIERLGFSDGATDLFDRFVSKITADAYSPTLFRLDVYVRTFAQIIAPELSKRSEAIEAACEAIKKSPKSQSCRAKLDTALQSWISLLRPVQSYEIHRQREDATTREMYIKVRDLALWLANEKKEFESAGKVVEIATGVFGHLPRAAAQMKEEAAQLLDLRNEQLAEEILTPLLQACEAANKSHRAIESELLRAGFGPGSTGSVKALFDKFATAVGSTAKLPFSDAPWRLVREVAISLNNDSSAPRAAENLLQGILDFADHKPPTAEMIKALREDQRVVRKNQVEADLGKSLQAEKWGEAEKLAERLLTLETDEENLKSARQIRETVSAKHKAVVRTRWFWGIAAAGVLIWIVASNDNNRSGTTNYRPSPPSYSATTNSPTTMTRNDAFVPGDTSETMPAVGSGLSLSRSNIRYCSYQGIRLEAARSMITTESQRQGFNTGIDDFNSRCSNYRYRQSDKNAVDAELPGKRYALDAEGRALAATWQSNSLPRPRVNR